MKNYCKQDSDRQEKQSISSLTILELDVYISIDRGPYFSTKYGNAAAMLKKEHKYVCYFNIRLYYLIHDYYTMLTISEFLAKYRSKSAIYVPNFLARICKLFC